MIGALSALVGGPQILLLEISYEGIRSRLMIVLL